MAEPLEPGTVVAGRYRVGALLGEGGMGAVYEAENLLTERRVALKWIHDESAADSTAVERLLREAKLASRIEHPHVVDVYDVGEHDGSVFLVMELLRGETLKDVYARRGRLEAQELIGLLRPVLQALITVHGKKIVHRDLKPSNIFLAEVEGRDTPVPKLLDFGIARDNDGSGRVTGTGQIVGTPAYMPPELIDGVHVDARVDVYAMGVILYEGLVGRRPYVGSSVFHTISKIMAGDAEPPHVASPEISETLGRVVLRAIAPDPDRRFGSVEALAQALEPFRASGDAGSSSVYPTISPPEPKPTRAFPLVPLGVLAGLVVVAVAIYPLLVAPEEEPVLAPSAPEPAPTPLPDEPEPPVEPQPTPEPVAQEPPGEGVSDTEDAATAEAQTPEVEPPRRRRRRARRAEPETDPDPETEPGGGRFGLEPTQF